MKNLNKMELETKEIAAYLPYRLMCEVKDLGEVVIAELHAVYADGTCTFCDTVESEKGFDWVKPILKPLSTFGDSDDLRKAHEFIGLGKWCEHYDHYFDIWFDDAENIQKLVLHAPCDIFQYFLSEHYDVFDLIKKGLAVSGSKLACQITSDK